MPRPTRYLLAGLGLLNVGLGILGAVLPGLPTTIFLIIASWCFTRSCPWLEERLFRIPLLRPYVKLVRGEEPLSTRARVASALMMWSAITISLIVLHTSGRLPIWLAVVLVASGVVGTLVIARFRRPHSRTRVVPSQGT